MTEWDVLRALDLKRLAADMAQPVLVDLRNVYPPEEVEEARACAGTASAARRGADAGNRGSAGSFIASKRRRG